jgi:DNA-binding transcriptional ArsR family regulator
MSMYHSAMARASTTSDVFNAVAEPRRRQILDALASGEHAVGELVHTLHVAQPVVSKHLKVLLEVDLVAARDAGRQRLYRLNGAPLKTIYDWARSFEQSWSQALDQMDIVLQELKSQEGQ